MTEDLELFPCFVCGLPAELMRRWRERQPNSQRYIPRVLLKCVVRHWVALDESELRGFLEVAGTSEAAVAVAALDAHALE